LYHVEFEHGPLKRGEEERSKLMLNVRAASERDLAAMYAVYYLNEVGATENIPPLSPQRWRNHTQ
jgi:hypothetical protein